MKSFSILLALLLCQSIQAQKFNKHGHLIAHLNETIKHQIPKDLKETSKEKTNQYRLLLSTQLSNAYQELSDPYSSLPQFYQWLWGDYNDYKTELANLSDKLKNNRTFNGTHLELLNKYIDTFLIVDNNYFEVIPDPFNKLKFNLVYNNPLKNLLHHYYNETIKDNTEINSISLNQLNHYADTINKYSINANALLSQFNKDKAEAFPEGLLIELIAYHSAFEENTTIKEIKKLLNNDWFKQWFWIRSGNLKLNPFDFTSP